MDTLKERLRTDLTAALRAKDELRKSTIRSVLAAIKNAEVAQTPSITLDDPAIEQLIQTEIKRRNESAQIYADAGRAEQAGKERDEAAILAEYLPQQLSSDELASIVDEQVSAAGDGAKMGPVIAAVRARVGQRSSGGAVAAAVKARLG